MALENIPKGIPEKWARVVKQSCESLGLTSEVTFSRDPLTNKAYRMRLKIHGDNIPLFDWDFHTRATLENLQGAKSFPVVPTGRTRLVLFLAYLLNLVTHHAQAAKDSRIITIRARVDTNKILLRIPPI